MKLANLTSAALQQDFLKYRPLSEETKTNPLSITHFLGTNDPAVIITLSSTFNLFSNPTELLNTRSIGTREEARWDYLMP